MTDISDFSIKAKNMKCFGDEPQGFEVVKPVNLIIGRNNSGKSALLDLIEYLINPKLEFPRGHSNMGNEPAIVLEAPLGEWEVKRVFQENVSGGNIPGSINPAIK